MDTRDLKQLEHDLRRKYEWSRARRAVVGFAPAIAVVAAAALLGNRPSSALMFGGLTFAAGAGLLWYGRDVRRAVLPGVLAGLIPMVLALCANHMGHMCMGNGCMTLCLPACTLGGLVAGLGVAMVGRRRRHGWGYWAAASGVALLTGAMGCACVGYAGVVGLGIGFGAGLAPGLARAVAGQRAP